MNLGRISRAMVAIVGASALSPLRCANNMHRSEPPFQDAATGVDASGVHRPADAADVTELDSEDVTNETGDGDAVVVSTDAAPGGADRSPVTRWTLPDGTPPTDPAVQVAGDGSAGCLRTGSGAVWCWDRRSNLVPPGAPPRAVVRIAALPAAHRITATEIEASAVDNAGGLWRWGRVRMCSGSTSAIAPLRISTDTPLRTVRSSTDLAVFRDGSCRREFGYAPPRPCDWMTLWRGDVVAADSYHNLACAVMTGGGLECIREVSLTPDADRGRYVYHEFSGVPSGFPGLSRVIDVSLSIRSQCVLHESGRVSCWGWADHGETGSLAALASCDRDQNGYQGCRRRPTEIPAIDDALALVGDGAGGYCVIRRGGMVWCWGRINPDVYGLDAPDLRPCPLHPTERCLAAPARVAGLRDVVDFSPGWCAVIRDGRVFCLNDGEPGGARTPTEIRWGS